ncbi:MAG TPA: TIGR03854 family LLM class F420-dependent oxidoreductase [Trebonia sp.]|nr:TIGR03854 family LLM class F420-dependent oxidoreductase [Trebonia sp.]
MKVRIGVSLGADGAPGAFASAVDQLEAAGVDSLWLPENLYGPAVEPLTGIAFAVSRTKRLKAGSGISVLPGRHPAQVAKQLTSLAGLAPARVLPVFGLMPAMPAERAAFPVPAGERAAVFDESLTLLRLLLRSDAPVTFSGRFFSVSEASVGPLPAKPLDIWLAGSAPAALRRVGRFGDGWLGAMLTPAESGPAVRAIQAAADEAGREVEADHFGISLPISFGELPESYVASVARRRPGMAPESLVADGWAGTRRLISAHVDAGLSKFVVRPVGPGMPLAEFIDGFTRELVPLQTLFSPMPRRGPCRFAP